MTPLQLELTRLIGKKEIVHHEGCQAFSSICGKVDENTGNFVCIHCHRWCGQ